MINAKEERITHREKVWQSSGMFGISQENEGNHVESNGCNDDPVKHWVVNQLEKVDVPKNNA